MSDKTHEEIARRGGEAVKEKYGREHYRRIGKKGHQKLIEKYGPDYFTKILPARAAEARARRKAEKQDE